MRQVFLSWPWVHHEEPKEIRAIYEQYGRHAYIKKGTWLENGGEDGVVYLLLKGLGAFFFETGCGKQRVFSLILPGRAMADMDGFSGQTVNVQDRMVRDSEVLWVKRTIFLEQVQRDPALVMLLARSLIAKQESNMEAMIACYTLGSAQRLRVLLKVLLSALQGSVVAGWNVLTLDLNNEEFAKVINTTRVTVSRIFALWCEEGLVRKSGRVVEVHSDLFADVYDWLEPATHVKV